MSITQEGTSPPAFCHSYPCRCYMKVSHLGKGVAYSNNNNSEVMTFKHMNILMRILYFLPARCSDAFLEAVLLLGCWEGDKIGAERGGAGCGSTLARDKAPDSHIFLYVKLCQGSRVSESRIVFVLHQIVMCIISRVN